MRGPGTQASFPCLRRNFGFGLRIRLDIEMFESPQSGYPGCRVLIEPIAENVFKTASRLLSQENSQGDERSDGTWCRGLLGLSLRH